jgi:hypothetical protein
VKSALIPVQPGKSIFLVFSAFNTIWRLKPLQNLVVENIHKSGITGCSTRNFTTRIFYCRHLLPSVPTVALGRLVLSRCGAWSRLASASIRPLGDWCQRKGCKAGLVKNHNRLTIYTAQFHGLCPCLAELIMVNENTLSKEFLPFSFPSQCEKCRRRTTTSAVNHFGSNFLDVPKICYRLLQVVIRTPDRINSL